MRHTGAKAVLLIAAFLLPLLDLFSEDAVTLDVEALRNSIVDEEPRELIPIDIDDPAVALRMSGRWKGTLQAGLGIGRSPLGSSLIPDSTPFFTQEGDLLLSLWMFERWFVEAGFMDNSSLNTYRAGYQGQEGEAVRYLGAGNTGLNFPAFPYLDLGGESPSSFGVYGHFASGALNLHSLLRYDAAAREERTFVGDRERTFSFADLSRPQRGTSFVLPDTGIANVEVYIEDAKGNLRDSQGRRWRRAERSEHAVSAQRGLLDLSLGQLSLGRFTGSNTEPEGMIAVAYSVNGTNRPWETSLGSYGTAGNGDGTLFLGEIQDFFDSGGTFIDLAHLPRPGGNAPNLEISGTPVLVLYEQGTFSPFERQNRYLAPVSSASQAAVVSRSTGVVDSRFEVLPLSSGLSGVSDRILEPITDDGSFFEEGQLLRRNEYELVKSGRRNSRAPQERWALGDIHGELYTGRGTAFTEDLSLRFTGYFASGAYLIGTDIVAGSVLVFRNGIADPNFAYSPTSGEVTLESPASFSEVIRITYLRQSSDRRLGSIAAGVGAQWEEGAFSAALALGLRWNAASDTYTEDGALSPGTVGLGAGAHWNYEHLRTGLTLGLSFEQPDTTGLYRVSGMNGNELILPLPPRTSFVSETPSSLNNSSVQGSRANLIFRNLRQGFGSSSPDLGSSLTDISGAFSSTAPIIQSESGPYPALDKSFASDVQVLVAEFEFSADHGWTGFQVPLGAHGEFMQGIGKIDIPYRFANFSRDPGNDIAVYIQIGALSDKDSGSPENPALVLEKRLYPPENSAAFDPSNPPFFTENARLASFILDNSDREKLQGANHLRLVVVHSPVSSAGSGELQGRVILAPPVAWGSFWRPVTVAGNTVSSTIPSGSRVQVFEHFDPQLEAKYPEIIRRLNSESTRQRVLSLSWDDFSDSASSPGTDGRTAAIPLAKYRSLSFFVRRPRADDPAKQSSLDSGALRFVIARSPSSLQRPNEIALDASFPLSAFEGIASPSEWARVDIQYRGGKQELSIDGVPVPDASLTYQNVAWNRSFGQEESAAAYMAFFLTPGNSAIPAARMTLDEIILEYPIPSYRLNNGASIEWTLPGALVSLGDHALLSDASFQAAVETAAEGNPFAADLGLNESNAAFGMNGRTRAGITLSGFKLSGNYAYSFNDNAHQTSTQGSDYAWSGGHSISRSFSFLSFGESFQNAPQDRSMNHRLNLALSTPIRGSLTADALYNEFRLHRRWQAGSGAEVGSTPLGISLDAQAGITERTHSIELARYGEAWLNSFEYLVPDSGKGAESRDLRSSFQLRLATAPIGAELYVQGSSAARQLSETATSSSLLRLDFPVNPSSGNFRFLFRTEREYTRELSGQSTDFPDDTALWTDSFAKAAALMFAVPLYAFFDPAMETRMRGFVSPPSPSSRIDDLDAFYPNFSRFNDRFEFSLTRPFSYGISSLYVPNRFSFRFARILQQTLDTPEDIHTLGVLAGFSSLNLFGASGVHPVFQFYQGDEFSHFVETQLLLPKGERSAWSIRTGQDLLFIGFAGSELALSNAFTIHSSSRIGEGARWVEIFGIEWTTPAAITLLGTLYDTFRHWINAGSSWISLSNLLESDYELLRRIKFECIIERIPDAREGDYNRYSLVAGYESIVRIFGRLNLSVFGNVSLNEDSNARFFSVLGTVGTSLSLSF